MTAEFSTSPFVIGVSLKMYFGHQQTIDWCKRVAQIAATHPAIKTKKVLLFVLPSTPSLGVVAEGLKKSGVGFGAQDLYYEDSGAFTGAVSGQMLKELGCDYAEIGHAERRELFGETDEDVAKKVAAAQRNDLTPILCVGEDERLSPIDAARLCIQQVKSAAAETREPIKMLIAYEPVWAIGAEKPASIEHITEVCETITKFLDDNAQLKGSRVIYGGSAGPDLLTELDGRVTGLFLGRFAHDPQNLSAILDEAVGLEA